MKDQVKRCPKCNSYVRGKAVLNTAEGAAQGFGQGLVKSALNSVTFGIGGTLLQASGGLQNLGDAVRESITTHTTIEFACPCGYTWQEVISNTEENIPIEILQAQLNMEVKNCAAKVSSALTWLIIFGFATVLCVIYCIVNPLIVEVPDHNWLIGDFVRQDWQWGWIGIAFLGLIALIFTFSYSDTYNSNRKNFSQLKKMSPLEYQTSPLRGKYKL